MSAIIPAILTADLVDFTEKLNLIASFPKVSDVQIDFADGSFVPNKTIVPAAVPTLPLKYVFHAHLMYQNPLAVLGDIEKSGFENVVFHLESFASIQELLEAKDEALDAGLATHVALNPGTSLEKLLPILNKLEHILIMAVQPGFYGGQYVPNTEKRIKFLRLHDFYGTIIVDGGVDKTNIRSLLSAGADSVVVGSAIFGNKDPKSSYLELLKEAGE